MAHDDVAPASESKASHEHSGMSVFYWVWGGLLILTAIEVVLAYRNMALVTMLFILLGLSFIKSGLIIGWFMHLKYETKRMRWLLMASLVACLCLMMAFFPDSFRLLRMGIQGH